MPKPTEKKRAKIPACPDAATYKRLRQRSMDRVEHMLREHFEAEAPNSGVSSSFGALIDMALAGPRGGTARSPDARLAKDGRLAAVRRHRTIAAALRSIPDAETVLWAAYGDHRLPAEVYAPDFYGPEAGVALLTATAAREFDAEIKRREAAVSASTEDEPDAEAVARYETLRQEQIGSVEKAITVTRSQLRAAVRKGDIIASRSLRETLERHRNDRRDIRANMDRVIVTLPADVVARQHGLQRFKGATIGEWLRSKRSKPFREAIRNEASDLLREARARFQTAYEAAKEELRARGGWEKRERQEAAETVRRARRSERDTREPEATELYELELA